MIKPMPSFFRLYCARFVAALYVVVCAIGLSSIATTTFAVPVSVPPASKIGPVSLPSDLDPNCVAAFEAPVVETYLQGWRRAEIKLYDCLGVALAPARAAPHLARLPTRGTIKIEAINWDNGLYGIRLGGRLYFVNEADAIRIGLEPRNLPVDQGQSRSLGVSVAPATAPLDGPQPQDNRIHQVQVFYGTDRMPIAKGNGAQRVGYLSARGPVSYGTATVTLPPRHERGELERPSLWRLETVADPAKHVTFGRAVPAQSREAFLVDVRNLVASSTEKQAFVFVHGFNTGFEAAALRTAQMYHDLGFDGAPIFWSWASKARPDPFAYFADTRAAQQTVDDLAAFLTMVARETGATRVHVIAHSMGNQATIAALDQIASRGPLTRALFDQVVLCSPDVNRSEFERVASRIQTTANRTTLYASANDRALQVSARLNGGGRRLGDATDGVVTRLGLESVDASKVTTELFGLNHTFFSSVPSVMGDLKTVLSTPALPQQRGLLEVRSGEQGVPWWAIP